MYSSSSPVDRNKTRSEEHTSELQSQSNLVCRLLLDKKNNKELPELATPAILKLRNICRPPDGMAVLEYHAKAHNTCLLTLCTCFPLQSLAHPLEWC